MAALWEKHKAGFSSRSGAVGHPRNARERLPCSLLAQQTAYKSGNNQAQASLLCGAQRTSRDETTRPPHTLGK